MAKRFNIHDWANLGKYQTENAALKLAGEGSKKRIVLMGDSITEAWLVANPDFFKHNNYINRGIGGQTSPQMLLRFQQDVIALNPKIVVILAGTNDIAENTGPSTIEMILDNIASMADIAKANHIQVVLCAVLPAFEYPWKIGINPAEKIASLNVLIKNYAKTNHFPFVDYFSEMKDDNNGLKTTYSDDGVHPNTTGYQIMEPILETALQKLLKP